MLNGVKHLAKYPGQIPGEILRYAQDDTICLIPPLPFGMAVMTVPPYE